MFQYLLATVFLLMLLYVPFTYKTGKIGAQNDMLMRFVPMFLGVRLEDE